MDTATLHINSNLTIDEVLRLHGDTLPDALRVKVEEVANACAELETAEERADEATYACEQAQKRIDGVDDDLHRLARRIEDGDFDARTKAERERAFSNLASELDTIRQTLQGIHAALDLE